MAHQATLQLLKKCDTEVKKGITSIKSVSEVIQNPDFKLMAMEIKDELKKCEAEISKQQTALKEAQKEESKVAETLSKLVANTKLLLEKTDKHIASLLFDDCNNALKTLYTAVNDYALAEKDTTYLAIRIIQTMIDLRENLVAYL